MIVMFPRETAAASTPRHINPIAWHQALGFARQACARIFRDGGTPTDALAAFGLKATSVTDWSRAVDLIAEAMSSTQRRNAA
jgi:hypothetical protein